MRAAGTFDLLQDHPLYTLTLISLIDILRIEPDPNGTGMCNWTLWEFQMLKKSKLWRRQQKLDKRRQNYLHLLWINCCLPPLQFRLVVRQYIRFLMQQCPLVVSFNVIPVCTCYFQTQAPFHFYIWRFRRLSLRNLRDGLFSSRVWSPHIARNNDSYYANSAHGKMWLGWAVPAKKHSTQGPGLAAGDQIRFR